MEIIWICDTRVSFLFIIKFFVSERFYDDKKIKFRYSYPLLCSVPIQWNLVYPWDYSLLQTKHEVTASHFKPFKCLPRCYNVTASVLSIVNDSYLHFIQAQSSFLLKIHTALVIDWWVIIILKYHDHNHCGCCLYWKLISDIW